MGSNSGIERNWLVSVNGLNIYFLLREVIITYSPGSKTIEQIRTPYVFQITSIDIYSSVQPVSLINRVSGASGIGCRMRRHASYPTLYNTLRAAAL